MASAFEWKIVDRIQRKSCRRSRWKVRGWETRREIKRISLTRDPLNFLDWELIRDGEWAENCWRVRRKNLPPHSSFARLKNSLKLQFYVVGGIRMHPAESSFDYSTRRRRRQMRREKMCTRTKKTAQSDGEEVSFQTNNKNCKNMLISKSIARLAHETDSELLL